MSWLDQTIGEPRTPRRVLERFILEFTGHIGDIRWLLVSMLFVSTRLSVPIVSLVFDRVSKGESSVKIAHDEVFDLTDNLSKPPRRVTLNFERSSWGGKVR